MRNVNLILVAILLLLANFAGASELKPFTANGDSISLDGTWLFQVDNKEKEGVGLKEGWEKAGYDDSGWKTIKVGSSWETQGYNYDGVAWYRQKVLIPSEWKNDVLLFNLGRPDDRGEVYFNGEKVAEVKAFGPHFVFKVPVEKIRFGSENSIAVRVADWYKEGGLNDGIFSIRRFAPLGAGKAGSVVPEPMKLSLTQDLKDGLLGDNRWEYGWRDEGTSDTRPRMGVERAAFKGGDAVAMDVWYPNSQEYVDYYLKNGEKGADWKKKGYDYISFWYRSGVDGEIQVKLNQGKIRWKNGGGMSYGARVFVEAGDWKKVILPFSAFTRNSGHGNVPQELSDPSFADALVIGYGNHELQKPGKILFADFQAGAFQVAAEGQPISLAGLWRFKLDDQRPDGTKSVFRKDTEESKRDSAGYGLELGWNKPDFDDKSWDIISIPGSWESQGYAYDGPAWYRQKVFIPEDWRGKSLRLRLGQPDDRGELYWNGNEIQKIDKFGPEFDVVLKPEQIKYGQFNSLAARVHDWYVNGGINGDKLFISPDAGSIMLRVAGQPDTLAKPEDFEMGPKPGKTLELVFKFYGKLGKGDGQTLDYRLIDCFHRTVLNGNAPVKRAEDGDLLAAVKLTPDEAEQLYYGEWFDASALLKNKDGEPLKAFSWHQQTLKYEGRDKLELPALSDKIEGTPLGKLKLIDVIECGNASLQDPHPYKQGGVRAFWGGRRAYATWEKGIKILEFKDRKYREADNDEFFGYRIGRGKLKPYKQYLLRILYPEDKSHYFAMDIKAGRNYQGVGFRTGVSPELCANEPNTPYPLSGNYEWCDHVVSLDDVTYGYKGSRSVSSENGFWVFFHDIGRVYSSQYDSGPAVAEMRLYEIDNPQAHYPAIRYPEGQKKRVLMMDWERQPEANPADVSEYARLIGLNALGPVFLKWSFNGYFPNSQEYDGAPEWFGSPVHRDGFGNDKCWKILGLWLDATRDREVSLIPRLEYGGSPKLPKEARVIGPDGKQDKCGRYTPWGANLLHPATWEDVKVLIDEVVGKNIAKYPNLGGILWRMRSDRVKCSYGKQDVEMFCKETGREMPKGDDAAVAKWASVTMAKEYQDWWQGKRRDFHVKIRDHLRSYRPDLKLYYYNWDPDGWNLTTGNNEGNSAQDWSDLYNVDNARQWYVKKVAQQKKLTDMDYVKRLQGGHPMTNEPHKLLRPELYRDVDGIALFLPVQLHYLSNNEPYIRSFETGDGLAVCNQFTYEEKGRTNIQNDDYETSEMTPAGPAFSMAEEVLSVFHGDPNVITWTPYTIGRSFITEHRRFAQAFLALPAVKGTAVKNENADVKVRTYASKNGTYVGVVHRGMKAAKIAVSVPGTFKGTETVTDLVTGKPVQAQVKDGNIVFDVEAGPMELDSYLVKF